MFIHLLAWAAYAACVCITAGGLVYHVLVLLAARRYCREASRPAGFTPPITILKPLAGLEPDLETNLRTFFNQDYPAYQILFALRDENDPAAAIVRRLLAEYPDHDAELLLVGEPQTPNAKVWSLMAMAGRARHEILVIGDSDIRATPGYLRGIAADFADPQVAVTSCPYRAVPGPGLWSLLEAMSINTEFWSGVLAARMLEGMHFAVGPTMALRKSYLDRIGGFRSVGDYLAEDFVLGQWTAKYGYKATLSGHVVDHHIGGAPFRENWAHRIRWARSSRFSRPAGYVGQLFTNPLPFAVAALFGPAALLGWVTLAARVAVAVAVAGVWLRDPLLHRRAWLLPAADLAGLLVWFLGFFGDTVTWRGRKYRLRKGGRVELCV